jgi:hypothetical protein
MDVEHRHLLELGFILLGVDAVDGTHIDARSVLGANARVRDDERH